MASLSDYLLPGSSPLRPPAPAYSSSLPGNRATLQRQLASPELAPFLNAYPNVADDFTALQSNRVNVQGSAPWNKDQAARALTAAGEHREVTAPPEGNIFQNLTSDVSTLAHSIGNLPAGLFNEFTQLQDIPAQLAKNTAAATNPLEMLGGAALTPGLRLLPGSYIAGQFAPGARGVAGLSDHPLYTALDVLPFASKAAKMTKTVQTAETIAREQSNIARAAGLDMASTRVKPIQTFLRNYHPGGPIVDPTGLRLGAEAAEEGSKSILGPAVTAPRLTPNVYGQFMEASKDAFKTSKVGARPTQMFGQDARDVARTLNRAQADMELMTVESARTPAMREALLARNVVDDIAAKYPDMTDAEKAQVARAAKLDPSKLSTLSPAQQELAAATRTASDRLAEFMAEEGEFAKVPMRNGPEFYDTATGAKLLKLRATNDALLDQITSHFRATGEGLPPVDGLPAADAAATERLSRYTSDPAIQSTLTRLDDARARMDWHETRDLLNDLKADGFAPLPLREARAQLRSLIRAEADAPSARFMPKLQEDLSTRITQGLEDGTYAVDDVPRALELASHKLYGDIPGLTPDDLRLAQREVTHSWQRLAVEGFDPQFSHSVTPGRAAQGSSIPVLDFTPTLSQTKARLWDGAGGVDDLVVSLSHQANELLRRELSTEVVDNLSRNKGITGADLQSQLAPHIAELRKANPLLDSKSALRSLVDNAGYAEWDPKSFLNPSPATASTSFVAPEAQLYLPKDVIAVLDQLKSPTQGALAAMSAPLMRIFRTSVLTMRPQWYLGNALGGAILGAFQAERPLAYLSYLRDGYRAAKAPTEAVSVKLGGKLEDVIVNDVPHLAPMSASQQASVEWMRGVAPTPINATSMLFQFKAGQKALALAEQMNVQGTRGAVGSRFEKLGDFGAKINSLADNMYNTAAYFEGVDTALRKGLSKDEAIQAGVEASRRVFETWDTLTPGERGIVKSVFPFYGFTRSMLKYVSQYPSTHPTRLAIMASLAKAEQADMDHGLPAQLRNLMYLGDTNSDGTIKAVSIGALNPFQDVGSYASMLGFLAGQQGDLSAITRNVNPLLSTALTQLGVDPSRGQGELYPELYYDPISGRLATKTGNPIMDFASNLVPQSEFLLSLTGQNAQFKQTLRTNPEAAGRMLLSSLGVPVPTRDVNLPQERMKAEVVRFNQQKTDWGTALKSGEMSIAERWPGLAAAMEKFNALPPEVKAQYQLDDPAKVQEAVKGGAY